MGLCKYKRKVIETVKAYKYVGNSDDGLKEVLKCIPGMYHYYKDRLIVIDIIQNERKVEVGDYIVILPNGLVTLIDECRFHIMYEHDG